MYFAKKKKRVATYEKRRETALLLFSVDRLIPTGISKCIKKNEILVRINRHMNVDDVRNRRVIWATCFRINFPYYLLPLTLYCEYTKFNFTLQD